MAEASPVAVFFRELRRRRVFRTAGYYVVGAWLLLQAAEILFPGFGIPEAAIPVLLWAAITGFPVVLVFGWLFDLGPDGIRRTAPATAEDDPGPVHLAGRDWTVLVVLAMILGVIAVRATQEVIETPLEPAMIDAARPGAAAEAPSLEKLDNSVAVLPFDNLSDDPGNAYFCDGIAEEILHSLGRFSGVNVIGRTSSFAFRDDRPPAPRISELLGARFLLQGSVRKAGDRVRIATQLLDEDGIQLWSESFDRDLDDAFAIQSEIAEAVSRTIAPRVAPGAILAQTPDPKAYDAYLRGLASFHRRDRVSAAKSFRRAIELDPEFASAHAELAATLMLGYPDAEDFSEANRSIARARALDPGNARAYAAQGLLLLQQAAPDLVGAERVLREALARDPVMVDALNWLGQSLSRQGEDERSFAVYQAAARLDPFHPAIVSNLARQYWERGEPAEAERRLLRLLEAPDAGVSAFHLLSELYESQGRLADLYAITTRRVRDFDDRWMGRLVMAEALLGRWERSETWIRTNQRLARQPGFPDFYVDWVAALEPSWLFVRGRYGEAGVALGEMLREHQKTMEDLSRQLVLMLAPILGINGRCEQATSLLMPLVYPHGPGQGLTDRFANEVSREAMLHLAWCARQQNDPEGAARIVEDIERDLAQVQANQAHARSEVWFFGARLAAFSGDLERALERLEKAVAGGWRSIHRHAKEPYWSNLRSDPRAEELLRRVRTDVAAERAKAEAMDANWDPIEWHRQSATLQDLADLP